MKKSLILSLIILFFASSVCAEEKISDVKNIKKINNEKHIEKEISKSFKKKAKTTLPKKNLLNFNKKQSSDIQKEDTTQNLSADIVVLYNTNDIESALSILNSISEDKRTALDLLLMGNIYQDKKDIDKAAIFYQKSLLKDKTFYRAYYNLGNLYLEDENSNEAIKLYKSALKYKYDFAYAHYNLGCAYLKLGDLKHAKSSFHKAINYKKELIDAYYNLAFIYKKLNNTKKAEQYLKIYNEFILRKL